MQDKTINIKDIPGYKPIVEYGFNFGHACIIQQSYHFSWHSEVAFYNRRPDEISPTLSCVAVWRIKQLH